MSVGAVVVLLGVALVVAAVRQNTDGPTEPGSRLPTESAGSVEFADPTVVYDPVSAGEPLPDGYRVGLARDQIAPVYEPEFTAPDAVDWPGDMLVIGVAEGEEAKAYPVTHLNSREMVIDSMAGIPILVTW